MWELRNNLDSVWKVFSPGWTTLESPDCDHCVAFLGKTLYSHSASLHPGVQIGTGKYAGRNPAMD